MMREMRQSEVKCKGLREKWTGVMGSVTVTGRDMGAKRLKMRTLRGERERTAGGGESDRKVKANKRRKEGWEKKGGEGGWERDNGENSTGKEEGDEHTSNSFTSSIPVRELSLLRPLQLCSALSLIPDLSNMPC